MEAGRKGLEIRTQILGASLPALLIIATPAQAASKPIQVPEGTVGRAAFAIGRQAGVNIAVPDRSVLSRRAPAIRGSTSAGDALARLARASGLQLKKVGANSYVLMAAAIPIAPRRQGAVRIRRTDFVQIVPGTEPEPSEIVVTASKRGTLLQRFPGHLSRIDGDEFTPFGVSGAEAIESRTVGFSSTHLGAGRNKLFIRGIADSSFSGPTQSPVGQYFGDMRTGYSGPDPDLKLVDMQSVEVLEGPQGTLYGAGALGGIVLLKPKMPIFGERSGMLSSGASVTSHGDAGLDASGMLNLPLGGAVALRAVGYRSSEGGYIDNLATGKKDINDVRVTGGRASLSVEVGPGWFVDVVGTAQKIKGDDSQYADRVGTGLLRNSPVQQPFSSDFALANVIVRKDIGAIRFRSTTGASWQDVQESFDATALGGDVRQLGQRSKGRALSNETRLWRPMDNGYSWLIGFSSIANRYKVSRELSEDAQRTDLAGVVNRVRETTVYGELGLELSPRIEATLGARYTIASLSGAGEHLSPVAVFPANAKRTEHALLPSAALLARPFDQLTLYARYQQGIRPGGLSVTEDSVRLYRNDRLSTGEIGFRYGQQGRDAFDFQGSGTFSRWRNIQADFLDDSGVPVTDNIGDGRVWTLSFNGGARLTKDLRAEAGLAWNDGKITRPAKAFETVLVGAEPSMAIPNIARLVARGGIDWRTMLGGEWTLQTNAYVRYVGKSRLGVGLHLGQEQGQYFDSGLLLRVANKERAITLSATNLTNEVGNRFAFGAPIAGANEQITPLRPRTIRIGFEQAF